MTSGTSRPLRIGLTGGIASGKSTVADFFAELGAPVIDTDAIAHEVTAAGAPALAEIRDAFGGEVFNDDGSLDRKAMRKLVFADAGKREQLERILHPRIREATFEKARAVTYPYVIVVVPLLVESPIKEFFDRILVVDCSEAVQLERLMARDTESETQARSMIAAQASREQRLAIADDIVKNDGSLADTRTRVEALHGRYLQMSNAAGGT